MGHEPTTARGRRSRERIVQAASALIREEGVRGAGVDQIIAMAGASKSQLYHYFSDKDDLVRAVIACRFSDMLDAQLPLLTELDSWAGIRRWLDMFVTESQAHDIPGCPIGSLAGQLTDRDEGARTDIADCFAIWEGYLSAGLESMRSQGRLAQEADPRRLAISMFAALQGGLLLAKTRKDVEVLRIALDAAYDHLRSFATDPPEPVSRNGPV